MKEGMKEGLKEGMKEGMNTTTPPCSTISITPVNAKQDNSESTTSLIHLTLKQKQLQKEMSNVLRLQLVCHVTILNITLP